MSDCILRPADLCFAFPRRSETGRKPHAFPCRAVGLNATRNNATVRLRKHRATSRRASRTHSNPIKLLSQSMIISVISSQLHHSVFCIFAKPLRRRSTLLSLFSVTKNYPRVPLLLLVSFFTVAHERTRLFDANSCQLILPSRSVSIISVMGELCYKEPKRDPGFQTE